MTTDLTTLLAEADAVSAAATPGPWAFENPMGEDIGLSIVQDNLKTYEWEFIAMVQKSDRGEDRMGRQRYITRKEQRANAAFIAASRDLIPRLVAACLEQMAENERLRELISKNWQGAYWRPVNDDQADEIRAALKGASHDHHG